MQITASIHRFSLPVSTAAAAAAASSSSSSCLTPRLQHPSFFLPGTRTFSVPLSCSTKSSLWRCNVISKLSSSQGVNFDVLRGKDHKDVSVEVLEEEEEEIRREGLRKKIEEIKVMLTSMTDGEISVSPYDTAWVALVKDIDGSTGGRPQFPSSLQWIIDNQLSDGSWGDPDHYTAHDRLINTLGCVIALKTWNVCADKCATGLKYLRDNMCKLEDEDPEHMPIGFEIAFPGLLDIANSLDLQIPYDTPALQEIYKMRTIKMNKIPKDLLHKVPTTLLHSLEGMPGLDWDRLLKLQGFDGSFLFSPASTAFALMHTKDDKCLEYLDRIVKRFNGGVPNVYPVDMFEHIWVVDRLQRLGISRYFESEIKECIEYINRYWTDDGICWARSSTVHDVDDTAMAFRLLRLNGYDVSADVFRNFYKNGEFFCFAGQSNQAVTGMYNLNRASQVQLPGESILDEARDFSYNFLREKQAKKQLLDKWIITKDLPGEVEYTLDFPFYASLPRVEARTFLEQYGGEKDVWIGKTLYRMPYVNNDTYLEAAKSDFNQCQAVHQAEWLALPLWLEESGLKNVGVTEEELLGAYFLATSSIFEPERSTERLAWARSMVLVEAVTKLFNNKTCTEETKQEFINELKDGDIIRSGWKKSNNKVVGAILNIIYLIGEVHKPPEEALKVRHYLRRSWEDWLVSLVNGSDDGGALLMVRLLELCAGRFTLEDNNNQCSRLGGLTSIVCSQLRDRRLSIQEEEINGNGYERTDSIDANMRELVSCYLRGSNGVDSNTKNSFLTVAKTFYYAAHTSPSTVNVHISKVLFDKVI